MKLPVGAEEDLEWKRCVALQPLKQMEQHEWSAGSRRLMGDEQHAAISRDSGVQRVAYRFTRVSI